MRLRLVTTYKNQTTKKLANTVRKNRISVKIPNTCYVFLPTKSIT